MSTAESGKISGRNDSECGHTGVNKIDGTSGCTSSVPRTKSEFEKRKCNPDARAACTCVRVGVYVRERACTMEPPAASEYAVLPVGVAMISPSACTVVVYTPSQ